MKKIKTIEFKEKKMIKRSPLNKYLIHSENNPQIGNNRRKNNYCQNLGISNERNEIKKIIDISMKEHIKNNNEKIINLDSNENSIDEVENEVIEIIESETKNQNNNFCKKIKFEENNDIILLSNNDDNDDENVNGIKKINFIRKKKANKKYSNNEINFKDLGKKNKINKILNNDEFHIMNKKINSINQPKNNNYKHKYYFTKIKNENKYNNYYKIQKEKEIIDPIRRIDLSITDNKSKKTKFEKNSIKNRNIYLSSELCLFYFLVEEYGIENVIDSIYDKSEGNKNQKNNLELCLQVIKQIYGENKLIVMAIQASIFIVKTNSNEIFLKKNNYGLINQDKDEKDVYKSIDINSHYSRKFENKNICEKNEKSISIISHYNRYKDNKIYKYRIGHLLGKFVIFYCFDRKCESIGIFNLETKSFRLKKKHNLKHSKHDYIINYDKNQEYILKEMIEKNYCDCQIFKEDEVMIVRYYS